MEGHLGAARRFALDFEPSGPEGKYTFRRAALRFGGARPDLRIDSGVTLDGTVAAIDVDEWLALASESSASADDGATGNGNWTSSFAGAELDVADFAVFGQELGATKVSARRRTDDWQLEVDSEPIAGTMLVPVDLASDPKIVAVMRRLRLTAG